MDETTPISLNDRIDAIEAEVKYLFHNAGAPSDGEEGTFAGFARTGSLLIDTVNGVLYINTGAQAAPYWLTVGNQAS
jgi:hypothetical protein